VEVNGFLDDRHYMQQTGDDAFTVIVRDLQDPRKDKQYPLSAPRAKALVATQAAQRPHYLWVERSEVVPETSVELDVYRAEDALPVIFDYRFPKRRAPAPLYKTTVLLPKDASLLKWRLSPQNDRIVYHVQIVRKNPVLVQLKRLWPSFVVKSVVTEAIYIGRIDEPRMYEIGHVPVADTKDVEGGEDGPMKALQDIQWLPDGTQISFLSHSTLYTVPAKECP